MHLMGRSGFAFVAAIFCCAAFAIPSKGTESQAPDASGLVPVGAQPKGGLSGKIVYTHAGHGYTAAIGAFSAATITK
jgi:hypothetical protein